MPSPLTMSETQEIQQENFDYTLFSWSKQKGPVTHTAAADKLDSQAEAFTFFLQKRL